MYKKILWMVTLVSSLMFGQLALADSGMCHQGLKKMLESIKLDDGQKEKIKPILEKLKSSLKDNWSQMKDMEKQIMEQSESANMDQGTVDGLIDKKVTLIGNMMKAKVTAKNQIMGILSAEQKTKMHKMMQQVKDKMAAAYKNCHDED
jgi:periplasmic protein CpxP/Spy